MSMVLTKALELGAALSECDELQAVKEAEQAMLEDSSARALIEEFQNCRQEIEWAKMQGMDPTPEQEAAFRSVRERMGENAYISRFLEAQDRFEKVLQQVNQIISHALYGGGCEGGCAGCSGCED
ncbi:YlbF family regulator [Desulfothermobacter acidiphilus]|uniref:YlbF family regulator n=1 Tax=Desulfothermobacter acidiphilus TaxID=1938353 RepID=UPI003F894CFB